MMLSLILFLVAFFFAAIALICGFITVLQNAVKGHILSVIVGIVIMLVAAVMMTIIILSIAFTQWMSFHM